MEDPLSLDIIPLQGLLELKGSGNPYFGGLLLSKTSAKIFGSKLAFNAKGVIYIAQSEIMVVFCK